MDLPFAVSLYGSSYTTATVSSNGWVSFGDSGAQEVCNVDTAWPNGPCLGDGPVLAVLWGERSDITLVLLLLLSQHHKAAGYICQGYTGLGLAASENSTSCM